MRTIKFRAWDNEMNKMIYPHEGIDKGHHVFFLYGGSIAYQNYQTGIMSSCIMQFTGLQDKNGKDIYEGDIVKYANDKPQLVEYRDCCFCFYLKHNKHILRLSVLGNENKYEIIGNIHENPEFLK